MELRRIKMFYISDFFMSIALGMIPLMTVLSYFVSSLSSSTIAYALVLALYNVSTTLPKMYVAKNLVNKRSSFDYILILRVIQLLIWLSIGISLYLFSNSSGITFIFVALYLLYAAVKGSTDVLYIDVYSRVISKTGIGRFFGYKNSFNSLAEFIGAISLVYIFKWHNISIDYSIVFLIVFSIDLCSSFILFLSRKYVNQNIKVDDSAKLQSKPSQIETVESFMSIISKEKNFKIFLCANALSIVGTTAASFYIPYSLKVLNITIESVSIANVVWLSSKVCSSIIWGHISDKINSKIIFIGSRVAILISYYIALNINSVNDLYLLMILHGISSSALILMSQKIFIEMNYQKAPLFSAINALVCMPFFIFMPIIASSLGEMYGFNLIFKFSLFPLMLSLILLGFKYKIDKSAGGIYENWN